MNQIKNEYQKTNYSNNSYFNGKKDGDCGAIVNINGNYQGFPKEKGFLSGGNRLLHYYNSSYNLNFARNLLALLTIFRLYSLIYYRISDISRYTQTTNPLPIIINGGLLWQY